SISSKGLSAVQLETTSMDAMSIAKTINFFMLHRFFRCKCKHKQNNGKNNSANRPFCSVKLSDLYAQSKKAASM
ncbi:MAG: hypothetical protein II755_03910, partial [Prevotella sp.]|nr:hypothetical protein [Prevotella sp.]